MRRFLKKKKEQIVRFLATYEPSFVYGQNFLRMGLLNQSWSRNLLNSQIPKSSDIFVWIIIPFFFAKFRKQ